MFSFRLGFVVGDKIEQRFEVTLQPLNLRPAQLTKPFINARPQLQRSLQGTVLIELLRLGREGWLTAEDCPAES